MTWGGVGLTSGAWVLGDERGGRRMAGVAFGRRGLRGRRRRRLELGLWFGLVRGWSGAGVVGAIGVGTGAEVVAGAGECDRRGGSRLCV